MVLRLLLSRGVCIAVFEWGSVYYFDLGHLLLLCQHLLLLLKYL